MRQFLIDVISGSLIKCLWRLGLDVILQSVIQADYMRLTFCSDAESSRFIRGLIIHFSALLYYSLEEASSSKAFSDFDYFPCCDIKSG